MIHHTKKSSTSIHLSRETHIHLLSPQRFDQISSRAPQEVGQRCSWTVCGRSTPSWPCPALLWGTPSSTSHWQHHAFSSPSKVGAWMSSCTRVSYVLLSSFFFCVRVTVDICVTGAIVVCYVLKVCCRLTCYNTEKTAQKSCSSHPPSPLLRPPGIITFTRCSHFCIMYN